jgi:hypothetical protein
MLSIPVYSQAFAAVLTVADAGPNQTVLMASDSTTVTVAENIQLFFHNYSVVYQSENSSSIVIEGVSALEPILNVSSYEKINCLQYNGQQEGQTIWGGNLMFQTSPLLTDLYVAGNAKITFFVNSTDSFTKKQGGGYVFGVVDVNETGGIAAAFQSDIQGGGQGNPFMPKPTKITLSVNSVDHVFKAGHRIGFFIGLGGNKKGWKVSVFFDSVGSNSGAILPDVDPPNYSGFNIGYVGNNYPIVVISNSSISNFQFNQSEKSISFQASMLQGTGGFCNVSVPISLIEGPYTLTLDGLVETFTLTSNSTCSFIFFTYMHEKQAINITCRNV